MKRRLATLLAFCVCVARAGAQDASPSPAPPAVAIAGSITLLPALRDAADVYMRSFTDVTVTVAGGGSASALRALANGTLALAATDFPPQGAGPLVSAPIAVLPFAIAVNPAAGVTSLTSAQIADLFAGKVTNWKSVGGADVPVVYVDRSARSGVTRLIEERFLHGAPAAPGTRILGATAQALAAVAATPGAFTVSTLSAAKAAGLTVVAIDGVAANDEHVEDGSYRLWAYEYGVTNGVPATEVARFLAVFESDRTILHRYGLVGVAELSRAARTP